VNERPFLVFGAPRFADEEIAEVVATLRSGWIGSGPRVARFEEAFRAEIGAAHATALHSCTAALHLSLLALGLRPGDEVITTPMTFVATANAILHAGAVPVFVDCDRATGLIDPDRVAAAVTPRTRALLPVHLYGRPCAMDALLEIAREHDLHVVEDAAHALEAVYRGRRIGTIGDATCFSFYVTKNITTGEGGMVTTGSAALAGEVRTMALHGLTKDAWRRFSDAGYRHYEAITAGFKYNMMDLQAALGIHQLTHVDEWLRRREQIWARYDEAFADHAVVRPAPVEPDTVHARHLYTLLIDSAHTGLDRDTFMERLFDRRIGTGVHYHAVHLHRYYRERFGYAPDDFPNARYLSERTVSLPLSPHLTDEDVAHVIDSVRAVLEAASPLRLVRGTDA
jgi:dTDP-4-amino-4,6-dideoxygalactose transaminase